MVSFRTIKFLTAGVASTVLLTSPGILPVNSANGFGFLGFATPAAAKDPIRYKPPTLPGPVRTAGTGSRTVGCAMDKTATLLPLVPDRHIGQTVSDRPPLLWYVAGAKSVEVTLVQPGVAKPIFEQTVQIHNPGIVQVNFPDNAPALQPGQEYRWSVAVVCNPKRRTQDTAYTQAFIKRLPASARLEQQLAAAKSDQERSRIYAEAGLWYDALATLAKANASDPANESIRADFYSLLHQVGLNEAIANEQALSQLGDEIK
ncbi:DUF928 domain-containing protein [Leptodesmis sichuanensis]|uniref:DUF928 domain-containing protein n=1 Tax=Leptodesmis sichuanensis TaxID=2906798 RepID=UPI001F1BB78D|nr:DUF928 domain-containing protein [Leptodesmis sichuanensis]UIE38001.1 DUF928 domain-containing protein [Leptodesmis sichuanensis A121]